MANQFTEELLQGLPKDQVTNTQSNLNSLYIKQVKFLVLIVGNYRQIPFKILLAVTCKGL